MSKNGGGGGIYVKNDYEMKNDIIFENLTFIQCEALYGGAIYIYSSYESNCILIRNCTFSYNMALGTKNCNIYGGFSIYMQAKNANVTECNFEHGKGIGGSFKISDIFDDNERKNKQLEETKKIISISGCNFEQEEKTNSIFYVNEKNSNKNEINIVDCKFKGKLSNGNHYIDGNVNVKDIPIFNIHSCEFEHEFKDSVKSELIKESAFNSFEKKPSFILSSKRKFVFVILFVSTFSLMILFVMKYKLPNQSEADKSIYENADNSFEYEKGLV